MLKAYLKILMRMGVRLFARLFFLFPIKKNRILFEAFQGKSYSGNPKYISEYLEEHYPGGYELVWTFLNEKSAPAGRKIRGFPWMQHFVSSDSATQGMTAISGQDI